MARKRDDGGIESMTRDDVDTTGNYEAEPAFGDWEPLMAIERDLKPVA